MQMAIGACFVSCLWKKKAVRPAVSQRKSSAGAKLHRGPVKVAHGSWYCRHFQSSQRQVNDTRRRAPNCLRGAGEDCSKGKTSPQAEKGNFPKTNIMTLSLNFSYWAPVLPGAKENFLKEMRNEIPLQPADKKHLSPVVNIEPPTHPEGAMTSLHPGLLGMC